MSNSFDPEVVGRIIALRGGDKGSLIPILLSIQQEYRYLPEEALRMVCERTAVSPSDMAGVVSFFPRFRTRPAGRHTIQVCVGTACHVRGALDTFNEFRHQLAIGEGEDTDRDLLFTIEEVACLGCCMLAPAVRIGGTTYGPVLAGGVPEVITDFLESPGGGGEGRGDPPSPGPVKTLPSPGGEVRICLCTSCLSAGTGEVRDELVRQVGELSLPASVRSVGCTGHSWEAPIVDVALDGGRSWRYGKVRPEQVRALLLDHFRPRSLSGRVGAAAARIIDRLVTWEDGEPVTRYPLEDRTDGGFGIESRQVRLATRHAGELDPLDLDSYRERGGFSALRRAIHDLTSDEIIGAVTASGLRGRGGGGYPTGEKWRAAKGGSPPAYVICNGDEGDPGAFMDRMILESFPFRVVEGMAVAMTAVGAEEGFVYIRGEYTQAIERIGEALELSVRHGLIGESPLGTGRPLRIEVFEGAGAFVCGEETAMIAAMEGRRGMPRVRPPFPSERGLHDRPTLVNNVETFALVPEILNGGHESFAALGTPSSRGTKTFALAGRVAHGGLIEVPMGTTLGEIVHQIGGGITGGGELKAVQVGGPAGGCIPASLADTAVDYEALRDAGAVMGSGGMIALGDRDCMVDLARYFTSFARRESCGKCSACRIGTGRMLSALEAICQGRGRERHLDRLSELGNHLAASSICGLGRTAPNTVLTTLRHFPDEYRAHLEGRCPAGRCKALIRYAVDEHCIGCTRCAQRCPSDAIAGEPHSLHRVDDRSCIRCDICRHVCPVDAVVVS